MSRIGRLPIEIPQGVDVTLEGHTIRVKGPRGQLVYTWPERIEVRRENGSIVVDRPTDANRDRAFHGLVQRLISNMVTGVTAGFQRKLEIHGREFRAEMQGKTLVMQLGYSHEVRFDPPEGVTIETPKTASQEITPIVVEGYDKQAVGQVAAEIRRLKPPEPYKGKGIRYADEHVRRKVGKKTI
jgi:large subunit ribosomal protein L6